MANQQRHEEEDSSRAAKAPSSSSSSSSPPLLVATRQTLEEFSDNVSGLWCPPSAAKIAVYERPPSALEFLREHVSVSRPCIIRNAIPKQRYQHQHEHHQQEPREPPDPDPDPEQRSPLLLGLDDLVAMMDPDSELTVDATPDGHGDCLRLVATDDDDDDDGDAAKAKTMFVKPEERRVTIQQFRDWLMRSSSTSANTDGENSSFLASGRPPSRTFPCAKAAAATMPISGPQIQQQSTTKDDELTISPTTAIKDDDHGRDRATTANTADCVYYYSRQNDCLRQELPAELWESGVFPTTFDWAEQAFGTGPPDAVNLWIGTGRAVSSMHKDHYENLFYVLEGEKTFVVCPPSDAPFLYESEVESGVFEDDTTCSDDNERQWKVRAEIDERTGRPTTVHWVAAHVDTKTKTAINGDNGSTESATTEDEFPLMRYAHPIEIRVKAGEMLYLPALWYHRVSQCGGSGGGATGETTTTTTTIAINYWFDMQFSSPLWCYFSLLQQLERK